MEGTLAPSGTVSILGRNLDFDALAPPGAPSMLSLRMSRLGLSSESLPISSPVSKSSSSSACFERCFAVGILDELLADPADSRAAIPFFFESRIRTRSLGRKDSGRTRPSTSLASRSSSSISSSSSVVKSVLGEALRVVFPV